MKTIQLRGHCQCCGREQAVVGSLMSAHGYTVEQHWFSGVCSGRNFRPIERERDTADRIIAQVRAQAAQSAIDADMYESGLIVPKVIHKACWRRGEDKTMPWAEGSDYDRERELKSVMYNARMRAEAGRNFANHLEQITNHFHGHELKRVERPTGPAPIVVGERRRLGESDARIARVLRVDAARVYWELEGPKQFRSWTGSRAWRTFPIVGDDG